MTDLSHIRHRGLADKVMSAEEAAALIEPGSNVGMSGFTGAGYPKAVPTALARRITEASARGERFKVGVWTGASTAPELDGALASVDGIDLRMPYQSDPVSRAKINAGRMDYLDVHLSHVAQMVWQGYFGHLGIALVEVAGITDDGDLIPSSSVGNNKTWIDQAERVILEVNSWQPIELEGMHDIYYGTALPPDRKPIQIVRPADRIGVPYFRCPPEKIVAVVPTHSPDRNSPFKPPDTVSGLIADRVVDFLSGQVKRGRLPATLLPLQSGVGNIANAVLAGLDEGPFRPLTAYTEVIQDGMLQMLRSGTLSVASATAFSLSEDGIREFIGQYRRLSPPDHPAPAGDQQPPRGDPPAGLPRDERHDRGRHLRQRQLHPPDGFEHPKRHRRLRRLRPQRLHIDVRHPVDRERRVDLLHRADGQPRRPHRTRRARHRHRAGTRRSARPPAATPRARNHRPLRAPGLPARTAGLPRPGHGHHGRPAHPAPARRGAVLARALPAGRNHEADMNGN